MEKAEKTEYYKTAMQTTLADLAESLEEREGLEDRLEEVISRISSLRETAYSLSGLCDIDPRKENPHLFQEDISPDVGFTDAVRGVFEPALMLTPVNVRDRLKERGFRLESYKNPLASIHTILKRLKKAGELMVWDEGTDEPTMYHLPPADERESDLRTRLEKRLGLELTQHEKKLREQTVNKQDRENEKR